MVEVKSSNGHINGHANGKPVYRSKAPAKGPGVLSWMFHVTARLSIWAAIFTIIFRCPASLEACDETSSFICKYYFEAKNAVVPHVQPYYDHHAAPYVEIAKPYYDAVDSRVFQPTRNYAVQYGAPWVESGQSYARAQWDKNAQPQITKIQAVAQEKYDQTVGPYLLQANEAVGPYYDIARTNALQLYYEFVVPGYEFAQPYAVRGYNSASDFAVTTALPAAYWGWNQTNTFLDKAVWPQLRVLYLENVEPQLLRIGERLGRYRSKSKLEGVSESLNRAATTEAPSSSFSKPTSQANTATTTFTEDAAPAETVNPEEVAFDFVAPVQAPPAADGESETRKNAREMVSEDLEMWQNKFAAQADEGANDMEDKVAEIAQRMINENALKTGAGMIDSLKKTVRAEMIALKNKISAIVETANEDVEGADNKALQAVRAAGVAIKEHAQNIRAWRQSFESELQDEVLQAADVHFSILDTTRNLALQKIGMKWAWTDGVTYKDWAKYHELKSTFTQWTDQLKQLIVTHPSLTEANDASARIEDEGMEIASAAARELGRLKEVAHWKIVAQDATDNYESAAMEAAAEKANQAKKFAAEEAAKLKDAVVEEAASVVDAVSSGTAAAAEFASSNVAAAGSAASSASESVAKVVGSNTQAAENAASSAADSAASFVEDTKSSVIDIADEASDVVAEQSTAASQAASSILAEGEQATEAAGDELKVATSIVAESASEQSTAASQSASSVLAEAEQATNEAGDELREEAETASSVVESIATEASSLVSEGQESAASLADVVFDSAESVVSDASSVFSVESEATQASEEADFVKEAPIEVEEDPLAQREETRPSDTPKVKPAFLGAMAQEVPERQPILEDYIDPDMVSSATNAAQEAYSTAVAKAFEQYSSAVSVVSAQIYGTAKPVHEQLFSSVSSAYDNAVGAASARFDEAVAAASTGVYGTPTPTTKANLDWARVEAIAAERLNDGRLWAELQYSSALIAMGMATPTPTSPMQKYYEQAKVNYYAGLGLAQERYANFMGAASSAFSSVTATPTPTDLIGSASSIASVAQASAASAVNAAEEAAESAYSAATDVVVSAVEAVDESIAALNEAAGEKLLLAGQALAERWEEALAQISGQVYGEPTAIGWYDSLINEASSYMADATDAAASGAASATDAAAGSAKTASAEAGKQYDAVSELLSELISGKEPSFTESVLSRFNAAYATAAASIESVASQASEAAASVGEKVGSVASQATEAVKGAKDEL